MRTPRRSLPVLLLALALAACGGGGDRAVTQPTPTQRTVAAAPTTAAQPTQASTQAPTAGNTAQPTGATGASPTPIAESTQAPTEMVEPTAATTPTVQPTEATDAGVVAGDFKLYKAKTGGWSIRYPKNWKVAGGGEQTSFGAPNEDAGVLVFYQNFPVELTHREFVRLFLRGFRQQGKDVFKVGKQIRLPGGGTRIEFDFNQPGEDRGRGFMVLSQRGRAAYVFFALAKTKEYKQYSPTLEQMYDSFRLPKK